MALVLILLFFSLSAVIGQGIDPCSSYTLIQETRRNVNYNQTSDLCDRLLTTGWYRFKDAEIPFGKCISQYHCGTHIPLWIQGTYPTVTDGMVLRKACGDMVSNDGNCCDYKVEIAVKNCQSFLVYYLQPAQGCSMAYCTDKTPSCTKAEFSKTGFPPCTDSYPILTQVPYLSNPVITATDYEFRCHIPYSPNKQDAVFEVTWLINGQTSIQTETLTGGQRDATLSGKDLNGHLNTFLSCSVVSSFSDKNTGGLKSPPTDSRRYWAGLVFSTYNVTLNHTSPAHKVSLTSTIPVVCRNTTQNKCSVSFQLTTNNENISPSTCHLTLKPTDWNPFTSTAQATFVVGTNPSIPLTPSSHSTLHINITNKPGKEWNNYHMSSIRVDVASTRPGAQCMSVGDPHYRSFDNQKLIFTNLHVGQYTLVRQNLGTFKVETRTWKHPGRKASFNCAVAAREGNDVITIDMCNGRWGQTYPKLEIKNPSMFENKTEIVEDPSRNHFMFKFQSGAIVKVQKGKLPFLNVIVYVPGTFVNDTEGLCGTFDGSVSDEYLRSTGQIDPFSRQPYSFIESWEISRGTSLFEKAEPLPVTNTRQQFCECTLQTTKQQCHPKTQAKPSITDLCTGCKPVVAVPDIFPLPPTVAGATTTLPITQKTYNFPPPTEPPQPVQLISRPDATRHCVDLLDKYPSAKTCIKNIYQQQFTEIVNMCVTDIELTGDTDMALSALVTLMEGCGFQALTDPRNIVNGTFKMPPEAKVCPGACTGNGDCHDGICACAQGYEGSDCSILTAHPPYVTDISGGRACDLWSQECHRPVMLGENMKENATKCNIKHVYYSDFGSSTVDATGTQVNAEFMSTHHVTCPLPTDPHYGSSFALQGYMVTLSNNGGANESQEYLYSIYNSECMVCDDHSTCNVKHNTCMIGNKCYVYGEADFADHQGWCIPATSNTKWTKQAPASTATASSHAPVSVPSTPMPTNGVVDVSHYTAAGTGCGCYFEPSRSDCACCKNYGCPCDIANKHVCFDCVNPEMCNSKP